MLKERTGNELGDLTARRIAYRQARQQARKARTLALVSSVCVDNEDLILRGGGCDVSSLSRITHRRLCARALAAEGISTDEMAAAWNMDLAEVRALIAAPLVDPEHKMDEIDAQLRVEHGLLDDE